MPDITSYSFLNPGAIAGILGALFTFIGTIVAIIALNNPKKKAIRTITALQKTQKIVNTNQSRILERIIPEEIFFKKDGIPEIHLERGRVQLVLGEPACGKTYSLIKLFNEKKNVIFLDSKSLIDYLDPNTNKKSSFIDLLNKSQDKYTIIFDGIDELEVKYGSQSLDYLFGFIQDIQSGSNTESFIISSRNEFYKKNNKFIISKNYGIELIEFEVKDWDEKDLYSYGELLLKNIESTINLPFLFKKCLDESNPLSKAITTPLDIQMLIYLLSKKDSNEIRNISSKFDLYNSFLISMFEEYCCNPQPGNTANDNYSHFMEKCFEEYLKNNTTSFSFDLGNNNLPIFKKNGMLIHYTFLEFAIAKYYYNAITAPIDTNTNFKIFAQEYKNEIEDFITASINALDDIEKEEILTKIMQIYSCTMSSAGRAKLKKIDKSYINSSIDSKIKDLSFKEFFTIKSKTNFRLGRMYFDDKEYYKRIKELLELMYYNDPNIYNEASSAITDEIKRDRNYYTALLKRGCAISASFYGFEDIEIDYVEKMLSEEDEYKDYDLANRSHTMLFYKDVKDNRTLFEFKDLDYSISCQNSIYKRINRLSEKLDNEYPKPNVKENKKYYFRLFDLATIYTFAKTRPVDSIFSESDKAIIRNCFVDFDKASPKRRELMQDIKSRLVDML